MENTRPSDDGSSSLSRPPGRPTAWRFVILISIVSLFGDMTYEGARSITGPYLATLGAGALTVALVAGLGELVGYSLRIFSGRLVDKTKAYWPITIWGYCLNLLAVPALALATGWEMASALIILERIGKAVRTPARDAMLSHAASETNRGWAFGVHEAMDQLGAFLGPALISAGLYVFAGAYRSAFALLLIPAIASLCTLFVTKANYPSPRDLEATHIKLDTKGFDRRFWTYLAAACAIGAGYADFPLIAYHIKKTGLMSEQWVPATYAIAMATDALAALALGRLFDRKGVRVLAAVCVITACFPPLVFLGGVKLVVIGMVLWGIGMGAQESVVRAAIAQMVPVYRRATAYGLFHASFGISWFLGSGAMGLLYDVSLGALVAFGTFMQLGAAVLITGLMGRLTK